MREVLARFGEPVTSSPKGAAVRLSGGDAQLADVVRALDAEDIRVEHLQLHAPTLDDVFLAKTGRSLEGAAEERQPDPGGTRSRREPQRCRVQVGMLARRSVVRTLRQPAMVVPSLVFPLMLLAINSSGLDSATQLPGFPTDSYLDFALAIPFVQGALFSANSAGTNVANDIETRLPQPAVAHAAAARGADGGPARRHPRARPDPGGHVPARRRGVRRRHRGRSRRRARDRRAVADDLAGVRRASARSSRCAPARARPCRASSR